MTKESFSRDENGHVTQVNYTEERNDGKTETRHVNPDSGLYTGKSVHQGDGETEYYTREEADMGSCCFITTACLRALGKPQDSLEFRAMKVLTKEHILKSMQGKRDYVKYGKQAPRIVQAIEARPDSREIWGRVYGKLGEISDLVFSDRREEGYQAYKNLVSELGSKTLAS